MRRFCEIRRQKQDRLLAEHDYTPIFEPVEGQNRPRLAGIPTSPCATTAATISYLQLESGGDAVPVSSSLVSSSLVGVMV